LALQCKLHCQAIGLFIALSTQGLHCRTLTGIEQADLNKCAVGVAASLTAKGIDFFDQVAFSRTTHRGITGHERNTVKIHSQQQRLASHARTRQRGFASRVASADDDHFICPPYNLLRWKSIAFGFVAHL